MVKHIESWDVEPARVVRQLLKPSAKVPATQVRRRRGPREPAGWTAPCWAAWHSSTGRQGWRLPIGAFSSALCLVPAAVCAQLFSLLLHATAALRPLSSRPPACCATCPCPPYPPPCSGRC